MVTKMDKLERSDRAPALAVLVLTTTPPPPHLQALAHPTTLVEVSSVVVTQTLLLQEDSVRAQVPRSGRTTTPLAEDSSARPSLQLAGFLARTTTPQLVLLVVCSEVVLLQRTTPQVDLALEVEASAHLRLVVAVCLVRTSLLQAVVFSEAVPRPPTPQHHSSTLR